VDTDPDPHLRDARVSPLAIQVIEHPLDPQRGDARMPSVIV
jgi:hypothetical protein